MRLRLTCGALLVTICALIAVAGSPTTAPTEEIFLGRAASLKQGVVVLTSPQFVKYPFRFIYRFRDGRRAPQLDVNEAGVPESMIEYYEWMRETHTGDIYYVNQLEQPMLCVISGPVTDLGAARIAEVLERELERPAEAWGRIKRSGEINRNMPGTMEGIAIGHCYLLETTEGKFVIFRILAMDKRECKIQFVYQPDGSLMFASPATVPATTQTYTEDETHSK